jgi:hypothetical protein
MQIREVVRYRVNSERAWACEQEEVLPNGVMVMIVHY